MVQILELHALMSDSDFKEKYEGTHFDETAVKQLINEDYDVYGIEADGSKKLLAKFRKSVLPKETVQIGWDSFRTLAMPGRNRGAAAGPIDLNSPYWKKRKPIKTDKWSTWYEEKGKEGKMRVNNLVASGVIGFYEETPFMKAACRMTVYTRGYLHLFLHGLPFIQSIDKQFKKLVPKEHKRQLDIVSSKPDYQIPGTAFSTVTVNLNFRTAVHKDAGDFKGGFGNLSVIEWGRYKGGYTLFPRFGIAFDVRTADFIAMDVHEWHCNTPMYESPEDKAYNKTLPDIRARDPTTGLQGSEELFQRLTFVCYFREKIQGCDEGETAEYYARSNFDQEKETDKAESKPTKTLLLPQYNPLDEVVKSLQLFGKTYRQRIPDGATRKLEAFMKGQGKKTRKNPRLR